MPKKISNSDYCFYLPLIILFVILTSIFIYAEKLEAIPATFFSTITAFFSFLAYKCAKEKFRLDLLEKRWEVYENILEFCSKVMQNGDVIAIEGNEEKMMRAIEGAHQSFRGIGYHKTRSLFDEDIYKLFGTLNESYCWLFAYREKPEDDAERKKWVRTKYANIEFICNTAKELPEHFRPYIYFGDYKR